MATALASIPSTSFHHQNTRSMQASEEQALEDVAFHYSPPPPLP